MAGFSVIPFNPNPTTQEEGSYVRLVDVCITQL